MDISGILADPDFHALHPEERRKVMVQVDPDFATLPTQEQHKVIFALSNGATVQEETPTPRIFSTPSKGTQQDVMGIASPKDRQAAETAQTFVRNDIPAVAKTFGAKIGGGMEQSIGGAMRAMGESQWAAYPEVATSREELEAQQSAETQRRANLAQRGTELGNEGRAVIQAAQEAHPVQTRAGRILDQTAQSIGSNLPGMAATMVTGNPAVGLSMMGLQSFGQTYDESRAKGLNIADATMNAAIQGGSEVATEMLPFVALSKYLKTGNLSKEVLKHYLSDIPGEHLATAIQNASDAAYNTADMTPQQRIDAAADYLASGKHKEDQIDTFFTTVLQGAVMGGVAKTARAGNALAPAAQPAPSGPLSRAVGMAEPATMSQVVGPPEAVEPVQGVADIVAQRRGGDKSAAKRRFVGTPATVAPVMAENQGVAPVDANIPELQGNPDAQISPVAGLSEPVDTSVPPEKGEVSGNSEQLPHGIYTTRVKIGDSVETRYAVPAPESMDFSRGHGDELYRTIDEAKNAYEFQAKREAAKVEAEKARQEQAAKEAEEKAKREDLDGFDAAMTPIQQGKAKAALLARMRLNGVEMTRKEAVKKLVDEGYTVGDWHGERTLVDKEGAFFTQKQFTKTGIDYAQHLLNQNIGVSNETADEGRQDEYAQGTESNADGEGQGRDEAGLQTVQRYENAESETVVTATPLDATAHEAAASPLNETAEPTPAQIEAGNYKKGHINLHGLDISIENPHGSTRKGVDLNGKAWETTVNGHYGYIKGTVGKDKDHIDVFVKQGIDQTTAGDKVFIIDQIDPKTGQLDEHKTLLGYDSAEDAKTGYLANYDDTGPQRIGSLVETTVPEFKAWLKDGDTSKGFTPVDKVDAPATPAEPDFPLILSNLEKQTAVEKGKGNKGNWSVSDFQEYLKQSYPSVAGLTKVRILSALRTQAKGKPLSPVNQEVIDAFRHDEEALRQKYGTIEQVSQEIADEIDAEDYDSAADFFDAIIAKNEGRTDEARNAAEDNGEIEALFTGGSERDTQESQREAEVTDDAGGWQQEVAVSAAKKVPTIGGVQKQGGRRQSTSDLMDAFTPESPSLFSTKEKETPADLTLERVQSSFPSLPVTEDNGTFTVTTPSGIPIRISKVGEIEFGPEQRAAAEKEYGRPLRADERPAAEYKPLDHGAIINLTERGVSELSHESFHAAMNLALTERQKAAVLRTFGNEEKAAAEYQRLKESGALETRKGNYWLSKIYRFLRSLRQLISPTAKGVMEDVASGKVWGKAHAGDGGARYAAAWHGSPHDFDKFKSSAIGTGEGAQAYGHGIYFASNKEVAEYYKDTLAANDIRIDGKRSFEWRVNALTKDLVLEHEDDLDIAIKKAEEWTNHESLATRTAAKIALAELKELKANDSVTVNKGRLYQVELAPSEDEYLLWDKPLSEQSEFVQGALARVEKDYPAKNDYPGSSRDGGANIYTRVAEQIGVESSGEWSPDKRAASEYFRSLGIRGIKYFDGFSRHEAKGNYNYVIFNDEDVEIKAKYSLRSAFTNHNPAALKSSLTVHPKVQALVGSVFNNGRNVSHWMRTVGTMYHMAEKLAAEGKPQFKAVFDKGQEFLTDVSTLALKAEAESPDIFPKMGTGKGIFHNLPRKDAIAIAEPLYQGTLFGGADPKKGKVFSDTELKRIFNLSDHQIELYKQARAATDQSLDDMAKSLIAHNAKEAQVGFDREMDLADMAAEVKSAIQDKIDTMKTALDQLEDDFKNTPPDPDAKVQKKLDKAHHRAVSTQEAAIELHESFITNVENLAYKTDLLKKRGYFPLMRFGQYTVTMKDHNGKVEFFGLYESAYKARLMTDALSKENPGMTVVQSVMGREKFKLFAGMNLEGLQLFAEHMKAEDSEAYQEYLKQAMNNRSAMKRLIHRKGTEGFSEDAVRTLANFITSNARHAATQYHLHDMRKLASDVPEDTQGDVQDQAVKLYEYLSKPAEEASKLRGYLFFHYLGGSLASGIVNMTQPVMMTMPYLASKTTAAKAAKHLTKASKMSFTDPAKVGGELGVALRRAESEGVTAPQEIYQLTAMASNKLLAANPYWNAGMKAWGGFFSVAEAFNRRVTFIASFRISREKGLSPDRAYTEAVKAITETQGIYNKGNRPKWGRGTVGGTLFTFKQFSVMYLELFNRLPANQKGIMLGILWLMAGLQGMPFAEDAEDVFDTIGQWMGYSTNSKRWINQFAEDNLGKDAGDFVTQGISSVLPLDLQGRMGLQNLIPGTGILKQSATDKGRDVKEFFGPAGGLLASLGDALTLAAQGLPGRAALAASPRAVQNIAQGVEMMATGAGHDKYGRKTVELSPGESAMKLTGFNPSRVAEEGQIKSANMQDVNLLRVRKNEISTQWAYGIAHKDSGEIAEAKRKLIEWNAKNPELKMNMGGVVQSARQKARALNTTGKDRFLKSMPNEIRRRVIDELG